MTLKPTGAHYTLVVGNVGNVYDGHNPIEARRQYGIFKAQSMSLFGRASGEPVTLFKDGEPMQGFDYAGTQNNED